MAIMPMPMQKIPISSPTNKQAPPFALPTIFQRIKKHPFCTKDVTAARHTKTC